MASLAATTTDPETTDATSDRLLQNVLSTWLTIPLSIGYAFIVTPIVIANLQTDLYGLWSFLNALLAYADLLYLGLRPAFIRQLAAERAASNLAGVNRLASVALSVYGAVGLVTCAGWAVASLYLPGSLGPLTFPGGYAEAVLACALLGTRVLFMFIATAYATVLFGWDRLDQINLVRLSFLPVRLVAIVVFVRGPHALLILAIAFTVTAILEALVMALVAYSSRPWLRVRLTRPRRHELRILYSFALPSFLITCAAKVIGYSDTVIIGVMLDAGAVALYSLPLQLLEHAHLAVGALLGVFLPTLTFMHTRGDYAGLRRAFIGTARWTATVSTVISATLFMVGAPFLTLWVGAEFGAPAHPILIWLSLALVVQAVSSMLVLPFFQAINRLTFLAYLMIAEAVVNFVLTIVMVSAWGIVGAATGTFTASLLVSGVAAPLYLGRQLGVPGRDFFATIASAIVTAGAITIGAFAALSSVVGDGSYLALLGKAALAGLAIALWLIVTRSEVREFLLRVAAQRRLPRTATPV
jgi:O-antigen/teichoic acid export membrane protein